MRQLLDKSGLDGADLAGSSVGASLVADVAAALVEAADILVALIAPMMPVPGCVSACQARCSPAPKPTSSQTSETRSVKYPRGSRPFSVDTARSARIVAAHVSLLGEATPMKT